MPGHFTHLYTARRVADFLAQGSFDPTSDAAPFRQLDPVYCSRVMQQWEHFTALGAIGPDIFFFSQDYTKAVGGVPVPSDEIMLALSIYYFYDKAKGQDYEPLLKILEEINTTWAKVIRFLIQLDKLWKELVQAWDDTIGKVFSGVATAIDDLTGGLLEAFQQALQNAGDALIQMAVEEVATFTDIFSWFSLNMRKGEDEQNFLWSDMTHYRRTCELGRNMVKRALELRDASAQTRETGEQFLAFALGWICHVGTDTIDHSFVNQQAGGPFRTHWQRHHLVENHIDAWNYRQAGPGGTLPTDPWAATETYKNIGSSAMVFAVALSPENPHGQPRPATLPDDRTAAKAAVDIDGEMPAWLADGIVQALIDTYASTPHPGIYQGQAFQDALTASDTILSRVVGKVTGTNLDRPFKELLDLVAPASSVHPPAGFPLPWQVQTTYRFMLSFYKLSFWEHWSLHKPKRPPFIILPPASDFANLVSAPDFSGVSSGDPVKDVCDTIRSLLDWARKEIEAAVKLLGDLIKMIASPGSYLFREGLYLVAMWCWDIIHNTHDVLAHLGFMFPHGEERYPDGELALSNEIDIPLIQLGNTVDDAFEQALTDNKDPFGNIDKDTSGLGGPPRNPHDAVYPWLPERPDKNVAGDDQGDPNEYRRPWAYPDRRRQQPSGGALVANFIENRTTFSGPYPQGATPDQVMFRTTQPVDPHQRTAYETAATPEETDRLSESFIGRDPHADHSPLGDAIPFSAYLIGQLLHNPNFVANFNLDADRGYGYLCWDWDRGDATRTTENGKVYQAPVTVPEGGAGWPGPGPNLALHYLAGGPR